MKTADLRTEYMRETLDESNVAPDPYRQFEHWFAEAVKSQLHEPNAMTLATIGPGGRPAARIVLLKDFDARGSAFFTNYMHWGEYRLVPDTIEFWQGRASRLHDRIRYRRALERAGAWVIDRLAP